MSIKDKIWDWIKPDDYKAAASGFASLFGLNTSPQYVPVSYQNFAYNGYMSNSTVFRCMNAIFMAFAEAPLRVYSKKDDEELSVSQLRSLIERPNAYTNEYELWEESLLYYYLAGNMFWEKVRSASGKVVNLYPLRPDRVEIIPSPVDYVDGYFYVVESQRRYIPREDVLHIKSAHPLDDYFGLSPFLAQLRDIETDNESIDSWEIL